MMAPGVLVSYNLRKRESTNFKCVSLAQHMSVPSGDCASNFINIPSTRSCVGSGTCQHAPPSCSAHTHQTILTTHLVILPHQYRQDTHGYKHQKKYVHTICNYFSVAPGHPSLRQKHLFRRHLDRSRARAQQHQRHAP